MAYPTGGSRQPDPADVEPSWDRPGGLDIKETRSWATWQLATAALIAAVVGMLIGYSGKKPSLQASASAPKISLGGPSVSISPGASATATSAPASSTTAPTATTASATATTVATTPAGSGSTTVAANQPQVVLEPQTNGAGPDQLPTFSTAGPWNIGWAFSCVAAPGGSAAFTVQVVSEPAATTPVTAVTQTSRLSSGVTRETGGGKFHLQITTDPACRWAVKVTGVAG